jgi:hypothetical protein
MRKVVITSLILCTVLFIPLNHSIATPITSSTCESNTLYNDVLADIKAINKAIQDVNAKIPTLDQAQRNISEAQLALSIIPVRHKYEDISLAEGCESFRSLILKMLSNTEDMAIIRFASVVDQDNLVKYQEQITEQAKRLQPTFDEIDQQHANASSAQATPAATPNADCNPSKVIDAIIKTKKTGDKEKDATLLQSIEDSIEQSKAACAGLTFKGSKQEVKGPVVIPTGSYKAVITTKGYAIIDMKIVSGDCSPGGYGNNIFNVGAGDADTGAEIIFESKDCKMYLVTSNISAPWTLEQIP